MCKNVWLFVVKCEIAYMCLCGMGLRISVFVSLCVYCFRSVSVIVCVSAYLSICVCVRECACLSICVCMLENLCGLCVCFRSACVREFEFCMCLCV